MSAKEFCKNLKLKFHRDVKGGFIASSLVPIRAGIENNLISGRILHHGIKTIGKRRVYRKYIIHADGDISHGPVIKVEFIKPKNVRI